MEARRGQTQQHVAGHDGLAVDKGGFFHHPHAETGQIVLARLVETGQLCGLAADERAARLLAAIGDAGNDLLSHAHLEMARSEVVEEEQRLGPAHHQVVHTHGHQIDADRVVFAHEKSQL